jgi:hypothetical protein
MQAAGAVGMPWRVWRLLLLLLLLYRRRGRRLAMHYCAQLHYCAWQCRSGSCCCCCHSWCCRGGILQVLHGHGGMLPLLC